MTLCSILRLKTLANWGMSLNPTYDYTELAVWSLVEMDVGVMCACMPGIAALFKRMFPSVFASSGSGDSGNQSGSGALRTIGSAKTEDYRVNTPQKLISKTTDISVSYHDFMSRNSETSGSGKNSVDDDVELVQREQPAAVFDPHRRKDGFRWGADQASYRSKW